MNDFLYKEKKERKDAKTVKKMPERRFAFVTAPIGQS